MTKKEHTLLLGLFAAQLKATFTILEILKSRCDLTNDDVKAFDEWSAFANPDADTLKIAASLYAAIVEKVGLEPPA